MEYVLFAVIGFFLGVLVAWFFLDNRCRKQLAEQEERLRASNAATSQALTQEQDEHKETRRRLAEMDARDGRNIQQIADLKMGLESAAKDLDSAKSDAADARKELEVAHGALKDIDALRKAETQKDQEIGDLQKSLESTSKTLEDANADVIRLKNELHGAQAKLKDAETEAAEASSQAAAESAKRSQELETDLSAAKADLERSQEEISKCKAEGERLRAELDAANSKAAASAAVAPQTDDEPDAPVVAEKPVEVSAPLTLVSSTSNKPDDLTKIKGIGKVLSKKLNDQGISTFAEIAALSQADIDKINKVLDFPGRIEREKWVEQAKGFLEEGS